MLIGLTLALSLLHASWIWPWFVAGPAPATTEPAVRILAANLYFGEADDRPSPRPHGRLTCSC